MYAAIAAAAHHSLSGDRLLCDCDIRGVEKAPTLTTLTPCQRSGQLMHLSTVSVGYCRRLLTTQTMVCGGRNCGIYAGRYSLRKIVDPRCRGHTHVRRLYCLAPSDTSGWPYWRCDPRDSAVVFDRFYRAFYASDRCSRITKFITHQASPRGHWDWRISGLRLDV